MKLLDLVKKVVREVKGGWDKEEWWRFRLPSLFARGVFHYIIREKCDGIDVMDEDWDNLIILDACRYDTFREVNWIKGILEKKVSRGSHTWMFLRENFLGKYFPDTVYLSSNPFILEVKECFYKTVYIAPDEELERYGTVLPQTVYKEAKRISCLYPDKRLIIHFLQPHDPFIGETKFDRGKNPFYMFAMGKITKDFLMKAYKDNLKEVLVYVEKLLEDLKGKTVVTSDHGESFGGKVKFFPVRIYGHSGPRIRELIEVPWLVVGKYPRKKITSAEEKTLTEIDKDKVKRHLHTLGYI
ncbi:MAG: hypothetical protein DRP76_02245 [Candidatus Omnitrophota bacterium]|mgnify:CR=1 FL=1|nr:MAG: hypothetical protein DRP76_02245 [Candidatus Omnitrophota bacterium]